METNTSPQQPEQVAAPQKTPKIALSLLGIIIIIALVYIIITQFGPSSDERTFESVELVGKTGAERLPEAFPRDIPVDLETITGGSSSTHRNGAVVQADVSYVTNVPVVDVMEGYRQYFAARGYEVGTDSMIEESGQALLHGSNGSADISILILPRAESEGVSDVNVSYVERQTNEEDNE